MKILTDAVAAAKHYLGVGVLLVLGYFIASSLITQLRGPTVHTGATVVVTKPTPKPGVAATAGEIASALNNAYLAGALAGQSATLSATQSTIAGAIQSVTHVGGVVAGGLAVGLTTPHPKQQVVSVSSGATAKFSPPPLNPLTDDQIQRDMKTVLESSKVPVDVQNHVTVSWVDAPVSPIFAAYASQGATGVGYTFIRKPLFDADALMLVNTGGSRGAQLGLGLEHEIKSTAAGIGVEAAYDTGCHCFKEGVYAAIHMGR